MYNTIPYYSESLLTRMGIVQFICYSICSNISLGSCEAAEATWGGWWTSPCVHNWSLWCVQAHNPDRRCAWPIQRNFAWILQGGARCRYLFYDVWDTEDAFSGYYYFMITPIKFGVWSTRSKWVNKLTHAKELHLHLSIEVQFISWVLMVGNFVMLLWGSHFCLYRETCTTFNIRAVMGLVISCCLLYLFRSLKEKGEPKDL